ncbi:MAG: hypothetical protein Q8904_13705 [Bacteroidota bacterium]|nr:hypothetical protein [Bacteroidota bacterium]
MALTKVLITVKTYPTLSEKYDELVCTAGFREDGSWIRIFPVPFRKLDYENRYEKWQWIEIDLVKNTSDFRPESYRPANLDKEIRILNKVNTKGDWGIRRNITLRNVYTNLSDLITEAKDAEKGVSLAVLKPTKVIDFIWEQCEREWNKKKLEIVFANQAQGSLFNVEETKQFFKVVNKVPYKFSYVFTTEDNIQRTLMIEDWELGMLYWNCLFKAKGNELEACKKVREKFFDYMCKERDLHFFMGTTKQFHNVAPNPFIIIGTFYPPKIGYQQLKLF